MGIKLRKYILLFSLSLLLSALWTSGYATERTVDDNINTATPNKGLKRSADDADLDSDGDENDPKRRRADDLNTGNNFKIDFTFKRKRLEKKLFLPQKEPSGSLLAYYAEQSVPEVLIKKMDALYQAERNYVADTPDDEKEKAGPVDINKEIVGEVINHEETVKILLELSRFDGGEIQFDTSRLDNLIMYMTDTIQLESYEHYHALIGYYALHIFSGFVLHFPPEIRKEYIDYLFATIAEYQRDITGRPQSVTSPDYGVVRIFYANKILSPILVNFDFLLSHIPERAYQEILKFFPYYGQLMVDMPIGLTWYTHFSGDIAEENIKHGWKNLQNAEWARDYLTGRIENFDFIAQLDTDEIKYVLDLLRKNAQLSREAMYLQDTKNQKEHHIASKPIGPQNLFEKLNFILNQDIVDTQYNEIYYNDQQELMLTILAPMIYTASCLPKKSLIDRIKYATDCLADENGKDLLDEDNLNNLGLAILLAKHVYYFVNSSYKMDIESVKIFPDLCGNNRYDITFFNSQDDCIDTRNNGEHLRYLQIKKFLKRIPLTDKEEKTLQFLEKDNSTDTNTQQKKYNDILVSEFTGFIEFLNRLPLDEAFRKLAEKFLYFETESIKKKLPKYFFQPYYMDFLLKIENSKKEQSLEVYNKYCNSIRYNRNAARNSSDEEILFLNQTTKKLFQMGFADSFLYKDIIKIFNLFYYNKIICCELFSRNTFSSLILQGITMHPEQSDLPLEERAPHFYGTIFYVFKIINELPNDEWKNFFIQKLVNDYNVDILCMEGKSSAILKWIEENQVYMNMGFNITKVLKTEGPLPDTAEKIVTDFIHNLMIMEKIKNVEYQNFKNHVEYLKRNPPPINGIDHLLNYQGVHNGEINNCSFVVREIELRQFMKLILSNRKKEFHEYEKKFESDIIFTLLNKCQQLVDRQATDKIIDFDDIRRGLLCIYEEDEITSALNTVKLFVTSSRM